MASDTIWAQFTGAAAGELTKELQRTSVPETWLLEIPEAQLDAILAKLRRLKFFQRSKSMNPEVLLAVELDGSGFAKNFNAVPALDALVMRTRQQGRVAPADGSTYRFARLPQVN